MLTLEGIEKLLKRRLKSGIRPSENELKEADSYISLKEKSSQKRSMELTTNSVHDLNCLLTAKTMQYFLRKEDISKYQLPKKIHPAGILQPGFVIEPIGEYNYVYNWCGIKGHTKVEMYPDTKIYYVLIEDQEIRLTNRPITKFLFKLPDEKLMRDWLKGNIESPDTKVILVDLENYFKFFLDLNDDSFYKILPIFVLQSWFTDVLNTAFFLSIFGQWGGGKTTAGELSVGVSKHGYFAGNPSTPFVARAIEAQKITLFIDELDSLRGTEDNDMISLIRQSYRRGIPFSRINKNTLEPENFFVFGPKVYSVHTSIEEALMTRSIPISISESMDEKLPVINAFKDSYILKLINKLFIWYIDNSIIMVDYVDDVDYYITHQLKVDDARKELYDSVCRGRRVNVNNGINIRGLKGRNAELAFLIAEIVYFVNRGVNGGVDLGIDHNTWLTSLFEAKKGVEDERLETGVLGMLRDFLKDVYRNNKDNANYYTEDGCLKYPNKEMYTEFNHYLKKSDRAFGVSTATFQGLIRELGFERPHTRKNLRCKLKGEEESQSRLCNIFAPLVMKKLGLKYEELKEDEVQEEIVK